MVPGSDKDFINKFILFLSEPGTIGFGTIGLMLGHSVTK